MRLSCCLLVSMRDPELRRLIQGRSRPLSGNDRRIGGQARHPGLDFLARSAMLRVGCAGPMPGPPSPRPRPREPPVLRRRLAPILLFAVFAALFVGLLVGLAATPAWDLVLRVIYRTPFGIADPIFSRDIGFYVFTLPGLSAAIGLLTTLTVLCLLLLVPLYWLRGDVVLGPRRLTIEPTAGLHLAILLAVLFLFTGL